MQLRHKKMRRSRAAGFSIDYCMYCVLPTIAAVAVILWRQVHASEFPERECCDPIYPPMPADPEPLPPALPTVTTSSSQATPIGRSGTRGRGMWKAAANSRESVGQIVIYMSDTLIRVEGI